MDTKNKIALITGGSRGLGKNMALAIAGKGMDVVITYHTNRGAADSVVTAIESMGQKAYAVQLDTSNTRVFDTFAKGLVTLLTEMRGTGNIDFLINNAGTALYSPVMSTNEEQMDDIINVHFKG